MLTCKRIYLMNKSRIAPVKLIAYIFCGVGIVIMPPAGHADPDPLPLPPSNKSIDQNYVNLISGLPALSMPSLSSAGISNEINNIGITGTVDGNVADYSDSYTGYIGNPGLVGQAIILGSKRLEIGTDIFFDSCNSGNICTYWDKSGSQYLFDMTKTSDAGAGVNKKGGALVQINKSDGEVITISLATAYAAYVTNDNGTYNGHHIAVYYPTTVASSNAWMIKYEYDNHDYQIGTLAKFTAKVPRKIYIVNSSSDYCDIAALTCSSKNQMKWPTWNIIYPNGFSDALHQLIGSFSTEYYFSPSYSNGTGVAVSYTYATQSRRVTGSYVKGIKSTYEYSWEDGTPGSPPYIITVTKADKTKYSARSDNAWSQYYVYTGIYHISYLYLAQISSFTDEMNNVTKYEYYDNNTAYRSDNRSLKRVITPEATYDGSKLTGGYTEYGYDDRRNINTISVYPKNGGLPQVYTYEYESTCTKENFRYCNKVQTFTDPNKNVTKYVYSKDHGGVTLETGPADKNGIYAQKRYTYAQLYPKYLDKTGSLVNSSPVWRLIKISECRISKLDDLSSCTGSDQESVIEYEYNNNNVLKSKEIFRAGNANVNQAASTTNVWKSISYDYDLVGNIISVDGPRVDSDDRTYTVFDQRRRSIYEIGADPDGQGDLPSIAVHHLYDGDGREYRTETGTGVASELINCSPTAATCLAFTVRQYVQRTYDTNTGLIVKSITATP